MDNSKYSSQKKTSENILKVASSNNIAKIDSNGTSDANDSPRSMSFRNIISKVKTKKGSFRNTDGIEKMTKSDFTFLAKIGSGGFGKVFLVQHKISQQSKKQK